MMSTEMIEKIESLGGKRWTKNGMDRIYINADKLGLECNFYKSGNVNGATFKGEKISNSQASGMIGTKTYFDVNKDVIVSGDPELAAAAADLIGVEYSYGKLTIKIA